MAKKIVAGSAKASRRRARKRASTQLGRRREEFNFRGCTLEELQAMPLEELLELVTARARRSITRGLTEEHRKLLKQIVDEPTAVHKTHRREMLVFPQMVGTTVAIHNGKEYKEVLIQPEMVGHYLGEFALTRRFERHAGPGVGATRSSKFIPLK